MWNVPEESRWLVIACSIHWKEVWGMLCFVFTSWNLNLCALPHYGRTLNPSRKELVHLWELSAAAWTGSRARRDSARGRCPGRLEPGLFTGFRVNNLWAHEICPCLLCILLAGDGLLPSLWYQILLILSIFQESWLSHWYKPFAVPVKKSFF